MEPTPRFTSHVGTPKVPGMTGDLILDAERPGYYAPMFEGCGQMLADRLNERTAHDEYEALWVPFEGSPWHHPHADDIDKANEGRAA